MRQSACGGMAAPRSAGSNQQVCIPAALPPAISAVRESPIIRHCSGRTPGSCARHRSKKHPARLLRAQLSGDEQTLKCIEHPGAAQTVHLLRIRSVARSAQTVFPVQLRQHIQRARTGTALSCSRTRNASSIAAPSASQPEPRQDRLPAHVPQPGDRQLAAPRSAPRACRSPPETRRTSPAHTAGRPRGRSPPSPAWHRR